MEEEILRSIKLRAVTESDDLIQDMIQDCIEELKDYLNYSDLENLPESMKTVVKELVLIKINLDGAQGLTTEKMEGVTQNYLQDIPKYLRRRILARRKLPRCQHVSE